MKGELESPDLPEDGESFDFREYLARQGIYSTMYSPSEIALLDTGQKPKPMEWIYSLRRSMSQSLEEALPEPQCSIAKAMLLGQRGSIASEVKDDFSTAGTSHLLAISGVHVSIVAGLALSAGVWIFGRRRPTYFLLALAVIWLYVMLSGMSPSAVRAATMGSLWLYANWIGRPRSAFTALTFAAAVMLAFNPRLLSDVGFQLSFAAMTGLVFLTPLFQNWGRKVLGSHDGELSSTINFVITGFAVTLGAVFATLPLISYYFGMISLMSLPATFFTLPAVPGIIITSAMVGIVGVFASPVATILGWVSWLFTTYVLKTVELFASLPLASVDVKVDAPAVWTYYVILGTALWLPRNRERLSGGIFKMKPRLFSAPRLASGIPLKWIILPLAVIAILIWTAVITAPDNRLHVYVLDIGQGDSILLQKGNQQIIIDGGPNSGKMADQLGDKLPFWDRTIELLVLTHPDADHITGLIDILQRYKVQKVVTSGQEYDSDLYREWCKLVEEKGVERIIAVAGQEIVMQDGVHLTVIHPQDTLFEGETTDLNNNSVVIRLEYGKFSFLLTGDIGEEVEKCLLDEDVNLKSVALKVAHHGSNTSTTAEFLNEVGPLFATISVSADNRFGHPSNEVVDELEEAVGRDGLLVTSEDGAIEFITDGNRLWIETEK
ncbi:MAG: DNA internalization-related competence protein ComEC/Rec2 [Chloroflexi bacterium]|nr:DNA internalization-related competence protein ComEC/Rec2 [Chloroflexota bacterium]